MPYVITHHSILLILAQITTALSSAVYIFYPLHSLPQAIYYRFPLTTLIIA